MPFICEPTSMISSCISFLQLDQIPQETKLREWLSSLPKIVEQYDSFSMKLQRRYYCFLLVDIREILSAYEVAHQTLILLLKIVIVRVFPIMNSLIKQ